MRDLNKKILNFLGLALSIFGLIFAGLKLDEYKDQIELPILFDSLLWFVLAVFALIYSLFSVALSRSWWLILSNFGSRVSWLWAVKTYGFTQISKYIPGNVMHFASRQIVSQNLGVPGWVVVKASMWEIGLICIAGVLFSVLLIPQFLYIVSTLEATIFFLCVSLVVAIIIRRHISDTFMRSFAWYMVFLISSGLLFVAILILVSEWDLISFSRSITLIGAFVVAWLIGFITPGSPAGLGVRELVLLFLLQGVVPESNLILALLLSRGVTVVGDVLFFISSFWISKQVNPDLN